MLIVAIVALVVVGPKDLPRLMRIAGQWMAKARAMAGELRSGFDELARQAELDELRKEIATLHTERPFAAPDRSVRRETEASEPQPQRPSAVAAEQAYAGHIEPRRIPTGAGPLPI